MRKSKYGMPPPCNRAEFEHNISLSFENALSKLKRNHLDPFFVQRTLPQLKGIEFLPNGRINFNSVDESLRLQANMLYWMELMPSPEIVQNEVKKISKPLSSEVYYLKNKVDKKKHKKNKRTKRTNRQIVERWQKRKRSKRTRIKRGRKK